MRSFANFTRFKDVHSLSFAVLLAACAFTSSVFGQGDPFNEPRRPLQPGFAGSPQTPAPGGTANTLPPIGFNNLRSPFPVDANSSREIGAAPQRSILQKTDEVVETPVNMPAFERSPTQMPAFDRSPTQMPAFDRSSTQMPAFERNSSRLQAASTVSNVSNDSAVPAAQPPRDFNTERLSGTNPADSPPQVLPQAFERPQHRLPHEFDSQIQQVSATEPIRQQAEPIANGAPPVAGSTSSTNSTRSNPNMTFTAQQSGGFQRQESGGGFRKPDNFQNSNGQIGGGQPPQGRGGSRPSQRFGNQSFSDQPLVGGQTDFSNRQPAQNQNAQNGGLGAPGQPIRKQPISRELIPDSNTASGSEPAVNGSAFNNQRATPPAQEFNQGRNQVRNQGRNPTGGATNSGQNPFAMPNSRSNNVSQPSQRNPVRAQNASSSSATQPRDTSTATALLQTYALDRAPQPLPGTPVSMEQMLRSTPTQERTRMVGYYWAAYHDWCKLHCSANYFNALKKLNGSNQIDQALLATAKSAAQNEMLAAEIQLSKSQSQLQRFIPNGQSQPVLPLPSDVPYTTNYTTHYDYYSSNRMLSSDIRNIATSLPKMLELVTRKADTVKASKSALDQTQGRGQMSQSLQAAKMWYDANVQFLDSVIDYNHAIAAYSLNVMSPYKPIDQVASALTKSPKSNATNINTNQRDRQATLPGFQQGRRMPSPDNGSTVTGAPGQPIQFNARSTAPRGAGQPGVVSPPQFRSANQSFSDSPQPPAGARPPAGNPGFQTKPAASGAPASFGGGFGGGFRE